MLAEDRIQNKKEVGNMTAYSLFVCISCEFETTDMQEFINHKDECKNQKDSLMNVSGAKREKNSLEVAKNA